MFNLLRNGSLVFGAMLLTAHPVLAVEAVPPRASVGVALPQALPNAVPVQVSRQASTDVAPDSGANLAPRELTGFLDDKRDQYRAARRARAEAGFAEDGTPATQPPLASLPVIDEKLAARAQSSKADERLRVIVHLDYLPHAAVLQDTLQRHKTEVEQLENNRQALLGRLAAKRDTSGAVDALSYSQTRVDEKSEREALRSLHETNEALSLVIKQETTQILGQLIATDQAPVVEAIEKLGGTVEFTMIAGNTLVVTLPAVAVPQLAGVDGIMRVVEDSIMEGHLNVADTATMVDPDDANLVGLWDTFNDGGIYDPAVIDSGTDLAHPALANNGTRSNWCSWYLVAANESSSFNDVFSCDDLHGHGTSIYGIVGSYGSPGFTDYLGMAYGVEKMVSLKAGWLNTSGNVSMFWSDKYNLVERALFNTAGLSGPVPYADDVEGFNLSYGGTTTLDDTDGGRFWDSVVSSISDVSVTITAGNTGPGNTNFQDPAVSYNAIAVGSFNDRGTTTRDDDVISSTSTVGQTANNRRKPDIVAPGTSISSPNDSWEGAGSDFINRSGSSYAAPMVLGVLMDLMDAAVLDELTLKALLLNTAQKNLPGMDIESDSDGWDEQIGWGAINAYAAYFHRFDTFVDLLTPNGNDGDFQLYKGSMRDEGSANGGEGRDRATMVWNRVATYNAAASPTTYYNLPDLNMRLYQESNEFLIDGDFDFNDNVHQVRIGAGAPDTDVIINAYAWSSSFDHGGATQRFALATEDGFERVDFPTTFQGVAVWPSSVEPNEVFDITFWIRNDNEIASHDNVFDLELAPGWTLIAGTDTQNVGSASGGGGITESVLYTLRAPATLGAQTVVVKHSHDSYNEPYGDFNWNINLTVEVDNTPPNPDPMSFSTFPFNVLTSEISMTASFANDIHGPVEYYLDYTGSPSFGTGGSDSGWQPSRTYSDTVLTPNDEYCYRAWARDNAAGLNQTTPSAISCAYTSQETPAGVTFGAVTTTSIDAFSSSTPDNLLLDSSGLLIRNETAGTDSGWKQNNNTWTSVGLTPAMGHSFNAQARNGDGDVTPNSPSRLVYTLANFPAVDSLLTISGAEIKVSLNPNGNSNEAEYFIENTTTGSNSGWINDTTWSSTGLDCETFYSFQGRARNGDGVETLIVPLGVQTTGLCTDIDGDAVADADDNCIDVFNPDQYDSNGDGIGSICDGDIAGPGGVEDCVVNFFDLSAIEDAFFAVPASPNWNPDADVDNSGSVNFADLVVISNQFFGPPGPSANGCN